MKTAEAIKACRENAEKRKFRQSFDISVNIFGLNMKSPESRFSKEVILPHGRGKEINVCMISDSVEFENRLGMAELGAMKNDKKTAKAIARKYDFFMSEPAYMIEVGKSIGRYLGPAGKMPRVVPPGMDVNNIAKELSRSVRIRIKDSPVVHCTVGTEDMSDSEIEGNISAVFAGVKKALPSKAQVKNAYLKLTMGSAVKIDVM